MNVNSLSTNLKMVKYTQTTRRQRRTHSLNVFDHLVGLGLKGLSYIRKKIWNCP